VLHRCQLQVYTRHSVVVTRYANHRQFIEMRKVDDVVQVGKASFMHQPEGSHVVMQPTE
jgi:hypothetical protein